MVDQLISVRRQNAISLADELQKLDHSLRSFSIKTYGRFVEIAKKEERLSDGKLLVRVAYAVNTS